MSDAGPGGSIPDRPAADAWMPLWTLTLDWELRRGRQVILHGQVNDRFWRKGSPVVLRDLLVSYLQATGAEIIGWWDPVDGLTFPVPGHRARFDVARSGHAGDGASQPAAPADGYGADDESPAPPDETGRSGEPDPQQPTARQRRRQAISQRTTTPRLPDRLIEIRDVLDAIRRVVSSDAIASAFVLQDIDAVLGTADPAAMAECFRLRAAMNDAVAPERRSGEPPNARNAVIAVTGDLSRLPAWLYTEDPRIEPLNIAAPDAAERRLWLSILRHGFDGQAADADLESLVGPTDGLGGWQLDALARTSVIRRIPAQKVTKLLDAYRYNVRSNPWTQLDAGLIRGSDRLLAQRVIGQDRAVSSVAAALQAAYVGVDFGSSGAARPRGVFFFVGPTGVGKTELAKAVAALIFGDESAFARFDMSEYQQEHAAERLAGAPPGFVGYEQGGELTRRVQERPFSVLLFDEVEKAHPAVLDKFLQILEDGRLTDGRGQTAYFSQCLIIFTSNTGSAGLPDLLASAGAESAVSYDALERHFTRAVETKFQQLQRPEIYGRLQPGVTVFDMLRPWHIAGITDRLVDQLVESARERQRVELIVDRDAVRAWMAGLMSAPEKLLYGGRQIRNELESLRRAVVTCFVTHEPAAGAQLRLTLSGDGEITVAVGAPALEAPPDAGPAVPAAERPEMSLG